MTRTVEWQKTRRIRLARWLIVPRVFPAILLILAMIYATLSEVDARELSTRTLPRATSENDGSDNTRKATRIETRLWKQATTSEASTEKKSPISPALGAFLHNVLRAQDQLKWIDHAARHDVEKEKQQKFATRSLRSLRGPFRRSRSRIRAKRRFDTFAESKETTTAEAEADDNDESSNDKPERFWLDEDMQFKRSADFFDPDGRSYRKSRRKQERSAEEGPAVDDSTLKQWARQEGLRYPGDWLSFREDSRGDDDLWSNGEDEADFGEPVMNTFRRQREAPAVTRGRNVAAERPSTEDSPEIQPSLASLKQTVLEMSRSLGETDKELAERNASTLDNQDSREASERDRDVSSGAAEDVDRGHRRSANKDSNSDEFRTSTRFHRNSKVRRDGYHQPSLGTDRISSGANRWNDPISAADRFDMNGREDDLSEEDDEESDDESPGLDDRMRRLKRDRHDDDAETNARAYRRVGSRESHRDNRDYESGFPRLERRADSGYVNEVDRRKRRSAVTQARAVDVEKSKNEKKLDENKETAVKAAKIGIEDASKEELSGEESDKSVVGEHSPASRTGFEGRREDGKQNLVGDENRDDSSANQATIEPNVSLSMAPVELSGSVASKESQRNVVAVAEALSPIVAEKAKEIEKSEPTDDETREVSDSDRKDEDHGENKTGEESEKGTDEKSSSDGKISETKVTDETVSKDKSGEMGSCKKGDDRVKIDGEVRPDESRAKEVKGGKMSIVKKETPADGDKILGRTDADDESELRSLVGNHKREGRKEERESNGKRTKEHDKRSDDRYFHGDRIKEAKCREDGSTVAFGKKVKRSSKSEAKIGDELASKVASGQNSREEVEVAKEEENSSAVGGRAGEYGAREENGGESDLDDGSDARQSTRQREAGRKLLRASSNRQFSGSRIIVDPVLDDAGNSESAENTEGVLVSTKSDSPSILPGKLERSAKNVERESANGTTLATRSLLSAKNEDSGEHSWRRRSSRLERLEGGENLGAGKDNASVNTSDFEENSDVDDESMVGGDYSEESVGQYVAKRFVDVNQDDEEVASWRNANDSSSSDLGDDYYDGLVDDDDLENLENDNEDEDRSATDLRGREQPEASFDLSDRDPVRDKVNLLIKQKLKDRKEGRIAHSKGNLGQPAEIAQYYDYDDEPGEIDSDSSIFDYNQRLSGDKDCSDGSCKSSGKVPVKNNKYEAEMKRRKDEKNHLKKPKHEFITEDIVGNSTTKSKNMTTSVKPASHPSSDNSSHTTENPEKNGASKKTRGESLEWHQNVTKEEGNLRSGGIADNDAVDENLKNVLAQRRQPQGNREYEKRVGDESSEVLGEPPRYRVKVRDRIEPGTIGDAVIDKLPAEDKTVDRGSEKSRGSYEPKSSYHVAESRSSIDTRNDLDHRNYTDNGMRDDEMPRRENGWQNDPKALADRSDRRDRRDQRRRISERKRDAAQNLRVPTTSVHRGPLDDRQISKTKRCAKELSANQNADFAEDSLPTMLDRSGTELDTDERTYLVVPPAREQSSSIRNAKNSSSSGSNYLALKMTDDLFKGGTEQSNPPEDKIPEPLPIVPATTEWQIIRTADAKARVQLTDGINLLTLDPIVLTVAKSHGEFSENFRKSPVSEVESVELDGSRQFGSNSEDVVHESFVEPADVAAEWEDETRPRFGRGLRATGSVIGSTDEISSARNQSYARKIPGSMKISDWDSKNETRGTMRDVGAEEPRVHKYLRKEQNGFEGERLVEMNAEVANNGDDKVKIAKDGGLVAVSEKVDDDHGAEPKSYRRYETDLINDLRTRSADDEIRSAKDGDAKRGLTNIEEWQISAPTFVKPIQPASLDTIESTAIGDNGTNFGVNENLGVSRNLEESKNLGVSKNLGLSKNLGVNKNLGATENLENRNNLGVSKILEVNQNLSTNELRQRGGRHVEKRSDTEVLHISPRSGGDVVGESKVEPKTTDAESNAEANAELKVASGMLNTKREESSENGNAKEYQRTRRHTGSFDEHSAPHWFENSALRQSNHRHDTERGISSSDSKIGRDYWKKSGNGINDHKHRRDRARSSWEDNGRSKWHTHFRTSEHNRHGKYGSYSERKWEPRSRWRDRLRWRNLHGSITKHRESSLLHNAKSLRDPTDVDALSKNFEGHGSRTKSDDIAAPLSSVHSKSDKNTRGGFAEDQESRRLPVPHGRRHSFRDDSTWQNESIPAGVSHKKKIKVLLAADNMEDESQMNMALHGELAGKIVEQIFDQVDKNSALKSSLGSGLDRKYKAEDAIESDKTYRQGLDAEEVKHTEMMMKRVMELLGRLVLDEVQKKTCVTLPPDMQAFLQWMLGVDSKDDNSPNQQETPETETHDDRGNQSVNDTFLFKTESTAIRNKSLDELNKNLGILKSLIEEYNALTAAEKTRVQVVRDYLARQLGLLLKYIEAKEAEEQGQHNPTSDSSDAPQYQNAMSSADNKGISKNLHNTSISGNTSQRASRPRQLKFKSRPVRSSDYKKQKSKRDKRDHRKRRKHKNRHRRNGAKLSLQYRKLVRRAAMLRHKRGSLYGDNWDPIDSGYEEPTIYSSSGKLTNRRSERRKLAKAMSRSAEESQNNPYYWTDDLSGRIRSHDVIGEKIGSGKHRGERNERRTRTTLNLGNEILRTGANEDARSSVDGDENPNIDVSQSSNSKRKREIFDSEPIVQLEPRFMDKGDASIVDSQEESSNRLQATAFDGESKSAEEKKRPESSFPGVNADSATVDNNKRDVGDARALQPWLTQKTTDLVPSKFLKKLGNKLVSLEAPLIGDERKRNPQVDLEAKSELASTMSKNVDDVGEGRSKEDGKTSKRRNLAEDEAMLLSKREAWKKDNVNQLEEVAFGKDMRGKLREEKQFEKLMALDKRRDEESLKSRSKAEDDGHGLANRYPENSTSHLRDVESSTRIVSYPLFVGVAEEASLKHGEDEKSGDTNNSSAGEKSMLYTLESMINVYADDEVKEIPEHSNVMKGLQRSPVYEVNADTSMHASATTDVEVGSRNDDDGRSVFKVLSEENGSRITEPEAELAPRELTASSNIAERRNEANDDVSVKEADDGGEKTMTEMKRDDGTEATSNHESCRLDTRKKQRRRGVKRAEEEREMDVGSVERTSTESDEKMKRTRPNDFMDGKQNSTTRLASNGYSSTRND